ncbi:MAG: hypothetical protein CL483_14860 [Acidobacteria bacterium]|nr:hypothetical protein [Acidobacteriota bacterium]
MSQAPDFASYLEARRLEIEAALEAALPRPPACPTRLAEAMRYSLMAGGKRLRPILALAAAEAVGEAAARAEAMPAACAIELIHTYSLVHDDLPAMDDDDLRRGRPTAHIAFGEGLAILVGDALLTQAFVVLGQHTPDASPTLVARHLRASACLAEAAGAIGMVGGQALDLAATGEATDGASSEEARQALREIHARKTGALIRAAAVSGAILGGADTPATHAVDTYAAQLGLAFQIVDDILDVEGDAANLSKTAGKDAAAGKPTYPALYGLDRSRTLASEAVEAARAALATAGLGGKRLDAIAAWVVGRTH